MAGARTSEVPRAAAKVWDLLAWRPTTWRQALIEAFMTAVAFVGVGELAGVISLRDDAWFAVWWVPLWVAVSSVSFAMWRPRLRRV